MTTTAAVVTATKNRITLFFLDARHEDRTRLVEKIFTTDYSSRCQNSSPSSDYYFADFMQPLFILNSVPCFLGQQRFLVSCRGGPIFRHLPMTHQVKSTASQQNLTSFTTFSPFPLPPYFALFLSWLHILIVFV